MNTKRAKSNKTDTVFVLGQQYFFDKIVSSPRDYYRNFESGWPYPDEDPNEKANGIYIEDYDK